MSGRVYIAGPMTGLPLYNFPAFDAARERAYAAGWDVVSPPDITRSWWLTRYGVAFDPSKRIDECDAGGDIYREFLRADIAAVLTCTAIALLPGWEKSKGVATELTVARALGLRVLDADTLTEMALHVSGGGLIFAPAPTKDAEPKGERYPFSPLLRTAAAGAAAQVSKLLGLALAESIDRPLHERLIAAIATMQDIQHGKVSSSRVVSNRRTG